MNSDLNQIQIFNQVAHYLSFTKAARALNLEKSTVSNKISQLEAHLRVRLFERTTRSVRLTEAGKLYLIHCQLALNELKTGEELMSQLNQEVVGKLRVNIAHNLVEVIMTSVIEPFLTANPKAALELVQSNNSANFIENQYDVAIHSRIDDLQDSSLIYRLLFQTRWVLVASPDLISQYGVPTTAKQLSAMPSVGTANESDIQSHQYIEINGEKISLNYRFSVNNMSSVIRAIECGLGFGIAPNNMIKRQVDSGELVLIEQGIQIAPTSLYMVYASRVGQPAKTKAFVELMVNWAQSMSVDQWRPS